MIFYRLKLKLSLRLTLNSCRYKLDPSNLIFVSVTDDGDGITDEDQKKLFQLFGKIEKTHYKNKKGCGLGLTICKKILRKMK